MTDPGPSSDSSPRPARRPRPGSVAPASRVLTAGLSVGAACAIVTVLALGHPSESTPPDPLEMTTAEPAVTTTGPPPTTIVINRIYVPVPAAGGAGATRSGSAGSSRPSSGGGSGSSGGATASSGSGSSAPAASSPPTPTTAAPAPKAAAKSRAS